MIKNTITQELSFFLESISSRLKREGERDVHRLRYRSGIIDYRLDLVCLRLRNVPSVGTSSSRMTPASNRNV
jgi:hypothetical protein